MQNISERLKLIASFVKKEACVCDVGTDHAYLPLYLSKTGKAQRVIATDIKEKPLENAKNNVLQSGEKNIELRLCDGLFSVKQGEADTVIIAGMGGEVISGIIDRCEWIKDEKIHLILQPMTSPEILREYLYLNGFEIIEEKTLVENGKIYSVISAFFIGVKTEREPSFYYIGKVDIKDIYGKQYIEKQYKRCKQCADALKNIETEQEQYIYYKRIVETLEEMLSGT